jgi:hypothetical protein
MLVSNQSDQLTDIYTIALDPHNQLAADVHPTDLDQPGHMTDIYPTASDQPDYHQGEAVQAGKHVISV